MRGLLTRWYAADMRVVVERYGGTVEKFSGDDVIRLGVPSVHEDDALRAVGAAFEMCRGRPARPRGRGAARPGAFVPDRGQHRRGARGRAGPRRGVRHRRCREPRQAPEQSAETGEILLGETTYPFVRDAVTVGARRQLTVKGKRDVVTALPLDAVDPWAAGWARRLDVPLVGRSVELERVRGVFERVLSERRCLLCTVAGPAGIGKSRLAAELLGEIGGSATVLRSRCLSYGEGITYWPLRQLVQQLGGDEALDRLLADEPDAERIAGRVRTAIGRDDGPLRSEETFWAVRRLFEALASRSPLSSCASRTHWAEPPFLDLLEYVAQWSDPRRSCCSAWRAATSSSSGPSGRACCRRRPTSRSARCP